MSQCLGDDVEVGAREPTGPDTFGQPPEGRCMCHVRIPRLAGTTSEHSTDATTDVDNDNAALRGWGRIESGLSVYTR